MGLVPLILEPLESIGLMGLICFDVGAALRAVAEVTRRVQFGRAGEADRVPGQGGGHKSCDAIR